MEEREEELLVKINSLETELQNVRNSNKNTGSEILALTKENTTLGI